MSRIAFVNCWDFLSNERVSEKNSIAMEIDIDSTLHAPDEATDFLDINVKDPFDRYIVARLISFYTKKNGIFRWIQNLKLKLETLTKRIRKS
jgi:hypothetical protein